MYYGEVNQLQLEATIGPTLEICDLEPSCAAKSGNSVPTFRDSLSAPIFTFSIGPIGCPETSIGPVFKEVTI